MGVPRLCAETNPQSTGYERNAEQGCGEALYDRYLNLSVHSHTFVLWHRHFSHGGRYAGRVYLILYLFAHRTAILPPILGES